MNDDRAQPRSGHSSAHQPTSPTPPDSVSAVRPAGQRAVWADIAGLDYAELVRQDQVPKYRNLVVLALFAAAVDGALLGLLGNIRFGLPSTIAVAAAVLFAIFVFELEAQILTQRARGVAELRKAKDQPALRVTVNMPLVFLRLVLAGTLALIAGSAAEEWVQRGPIDRAARELKSAYVEREVEAVTDRFEKLADDQRALITQGAVTVRENQAAVEEARAAATAPSSASADLSGAAGGAEARALAGALRRAATDQARHDKVVEQVSNTLTSYRAQQQRQEAEAEATARRRPLSDWRDEAIDEVRASSDSREGMRWLLSGLCLLLSLSVALVRLLAGVTPYDKAKAANEADAEVDVHKRLTQSHHHSEASIALHRTSTEALTRAHENALRDTGLRVEDVAAAHRSAQRHLDALRYSDASTPPTGAPPHPGPRRGRRLVATATAIAVLVGIGTVLGADLGSDRAEPVEGNAAAAARVAEVTPDRPFELNMPGVAHLSAPAGSFTRPGSLRVTVVPATRKQEPAGALPFTAGGPGVHVSFTGTRPVRPITVSYPMAAVPQGSVPLALHQADNGTLQYLPVTVTAGGVTLDTVSFSAITPGSVSAPAWVKWVGDRFASAILGSTSPPRCRDNAPSWLRANKMSDLIHLCAQDASDGRGEILLKSNLGTALEVELQGPMAHSWVDMDEDFRTSLASLLGYNRGTTVLLLPGQSMSASYYRPDGVVSRDVYATPTFRAVGVAALLAALDAAVGFVYAADWGVFQWKYYYYFATKCSGLLNLATVSSSGVSLSLDGVQDKLADVTGCVLGELDNVLQTVTVTGVPSIKLGNLSLPLTPERRDMLRSTGDLLKEARKLGSRALLLRPFAQEMAGYTVAAIVGSTSPRGILLANVNLEGQPSSGPEILVAPAPVLPTLDVRPPGNGPNVSPQGPLPPGALPEGPAAASEQPRPGPSPEPSGPRPAPQPSGPPPEPRPSQPVDTAPPTVPPATSAPTTGPPTQTPTESPTPTPTPTDVWSNYGDATASFAMCRGNPGRPESMPGGSATQSFIVPSGASALTSATIQIDADDRVTATLRVDVGGQPRATVSTAAANDTHFELGRVPVAPGDQVQLHLSFTATFGKIVTIYSAGSPSGGLQVTNSCSDGAANASRTDTGLRAVVRGLT